ncbi:hypothetical protein A374_14360 [Fictibacillus macauensis ZFHKF-1]|uniref:Knr4/Smi1-like domain-containing protein n=1 Tax=Fictibacillus macauensis ZFHKF-1 TaxID=1196324 RepID=I8AGS0_9BACL|nr:SMI1/KNR4 family protein [Fictibacillus macauensis]EIT84882.1 hypothetical protein A374_14360 [Fictibacillus macauensis ZFHKF-1]
MNPYCRNALNGLKKRLELGNGFIYNQDDEGEVVKESCSFSEGISSAAILDFEKSLQKELPPDYTDFLKVHNGANLFQTEYSMGLEIFPLEHIPTVIDGLQALELPNHWLPLAYHDSYTGYIYMDLNKAKGRKSNYLLFAELCDMNEPTYLQCNFEMFIERFIMVQGNNYWDWHLITAENAYNKPIDFNPETSIYQPDENYYKESFHMIESEYENTKRKT